MGENPFIFFLDVIQLRGTAIWAESLAESSTTPGVADAAIWAWTLGCSCYVVIDHGGQHLHRGLTVRHWVDVRLPRCLLAKSPALVLKHVEPNPAVQGLDSDLNAHRCMPVMDRQNESTRKRLNRNHTAPNHPLSLRRYHAFNLQRPIFCFEGSMQPQTAFRLKVRRTPALLACFMFDGQGLRPANDSPVPSDRCHVEMSKCKPTTPTASRSLPTPSKGCRRDAHRGPSIPAMPWFSGMMNTARRGTMPLPMTRFCQSPSSLIVLACDDLEGGPAREDGTKREKAFQCRSRC